METSHPKVRPGNWLRVLRPLGWWLLLVLIFFGLRTHQRLSQQTFLSFTVNLEGKPVRFEGAVTLDGRPVSSGERVTIGRHLFVIAHPKAEPYSTNLFIWYGERKLGDIKLKRQRGMLAIQVEPPAATLSILGEEFTKTLTQSAGFTSSVPTDLYRIEARWANHVQMDQVSISVGRMGVVHFAPLLGTLDLESDPPGATVLGAGGRSMGTTPLTLREMRTGAWKGELRLDGHIAVPLTLVITANQTNLIHTNLINLGYAQAMMSVRQYIDAKDYDQALDVLQTALKIQPNDPHATSLLKEVTLVRHLSRASTFLEQGDYAGARQEAEGARAADAENASAKAMLANIEKRQADLVAAQERKRAEELAVKERHERLDRPKEYIDSMSRQLVDGDLFDTHTLNCSKPVKDLSAALVTSLTNGSPAFRIERMAWPHPEVFILEARQEMFGGYRQCLIVGGKTSDEESLILFKVLEYETHLNVNLGGILKITDGKPPLVAVHPSRIPQMTPFQQTRLRDGVQIVMQRIQKAVGKSQGE